MPCFAFSFLNILPMALTPLPSRVGNLYSAKDIYSIIHRPYQIINLKWNLLYLAKHLISSLPMSAGPDPDEQPEDRGQGECWRRRVLCNLSSSGSQGTEQVEENGDWVWRLYERYTAQHIIVY